jgi:beta-lactam-binding protein with PASTA domain
MFIPGSQTLGTVVQQAQSAGSTVPYHAHVQLNVSRGPNNNPLEPVPNIVGMSLQQAVSALNEHHLRLIYVKYPVTQKSQAGKIVQQTPLSGAKAPANGQVVAFMAAVEGGA